MCVTVFGSQALGANKLWSIVVTGYLHLQRRISKDIQHAVDNILMLGTLCDNLLGYAYGDDIVAWIYQDRRYVVT